jgi:PAS domain-containing protein
LEQLAVDADGIAAAPAPVGMSGQADLETVALQVGKLARANALSRQALHASEERLALAVQGSSIGLWDWNLVDNHVHFSHEWAGMLGYAQAELAPCSETLIGLLHPDDAIAFGNAIGLHFAERSDKTFVREVRLRSKERPAHVDRVQRPRRAVRRRRRACAGHGHQRRYLSAKIVGTGHGRGPRSSRSGQQGQR